MIVVNLSVLFDNLFEFESSTFDQIYPVKSSKRG